MDGGSFQLLGLIRAHRGAVEYDFRTRFGLSLADIGSSVTITEAGRLAHILATDTTSQTFVALAEWSHPAGPEFFALADLFDAYVEVNFKNAKPYPRPHPERETTAERFGKPIDPRDLPEVMAAFGRELPQPA